MGNFEPVIEQTEYLKLLHEIRELKDIKKISNQDIVDKTIENGEGVCLSSVKKVFGSKFLESNFDYNHTLIPIYNALVDKTDNDDPINKILNTRLEIKREQIKALELRLENKEQKHKDREQFYMDLIDFLQAQIKSKDEQINSKDEQIKHHNEAIDRKDAVIKELYSILIGTKKVNDVFL